MGGMSEPTLVLADGTTASGIRVHAVQTGDYDGDVTITVDGAVAQLTGMHLFRDGGTREYTTDLGTLRLPHRFGSADRTPRWNGEPVGELPDAVLEEQRRFTQRLREVARRESSWR